MNIYRIPTGPLETNGYVVEIDDKVIIIDPSINPVEIIEKVKEITDTPMAILLTHAHFDHYLGIYDIFKAFGELPLYAHPKAEMLLRNTEYSGASMMNISDPYEGSFIPLEEGKFSLSPFEYDIFHVPGHSPGSVAIFDGENCFTGDALFAGSIGRTDFGYSSHEELINSITKKLLTLPDDTIIWPGHANRSTICREKRANPFLQD
jgi:glyoxylase-like metal-dependent hydrolase (beta-lactamase superfamily II)